MADKSKCDGCKHQLDGNWGRWCRLDKEKYEGHSNYSYTATCNQHPNLKNKKELKNA